MFDLDGTRLREIQKLKGEISEKIKTIDMVRMENSELKKELMMMRNVTDLIRDERYRYLLDKGDLRSSKMNIDLMQLTTTPQYDSLRKYLLVQAGAIFQKTKGDIKPETCYLLCQFAHFVESLVEELDRMKVLNPEEQVPEEPWIP